MKPNGADYIPVTPIPGTVVVNLGDLMQQWTVATKHRVVIPNEEALLRKERQSIAIFLYADDVIFRFRKV